MKKNQNILAKFLTICIFILASRTISAQNQIVFDKTENKSFAVSYSQTDDSWIKQILQKLAQGYSKPVTSIRFDFTFTQKMQISKRADKVNFYVSIDKFKVSGDTKYKNFSMEEFLIPEKLDFNWTWKSKNQVLGTFSEKMVRILTGETEILNKAKTDTINGQNYAMTIENYNFSYAAKNVRDFNDKVDKIDAYYSKIDDINRKINELNNIPTEYEQLMKMSDPEKVYAYEQTGKAHAEFVKEIKNAPFYRDLVLTNEDPSEIGKKMDVLEQKCNKLLDACDEMIRNMDAIYYNRGRDMLAQGNPSGADRMFNTSLQKNPNFAPAHFQLARLYYNGGNVPRSIEKIYEIRRLNPDQQTWSQTTEFADGIYKDFLLRAADLNSRKDYDKAILVLSDAKKLCNDFPEVRCLANMDVEYARAVGGKYGIILNDFDKAFQNEKLADAEQIIGVAKNYRESNLYILNDDIDIVERVNDLFFKYIDMAAASNKQLLYEKAVSQLDEARRIKERFSEISANDELNEQYLAARNGIYHKKLNEADKKLRENNYEAAENSYNDAVSYRNQHNLNPDNNENKLITDIKQKIHDKLIADALKLEQSKNFETALDKYKSARNIESTYSVVQNKFLEKYISNSAKMLILQKISEGETAVKINNLSQARSLYNRAHLLQSEYSLQDDREINKAVVALKDKIFQQECLNAQTEFDRILAEASSFETSKDYISCDNKLNDALRHVAANSECGILTKSVVDKKQEISDAVNYGKKINSAFESIKNSNYQSAVNQYIEASEYFQLRNVARYGLQHDDIDAFILKQNSNFVNFACGWYMDKSDLSKAKEMLITLKTRNYDKSYTQNNQKRLAALSAQKDYSENPSADYKSNISRYFGEDKYFKTFAKEYKKQWKKLK